MDTDQLWRVLLQLKEAVSARSERFSFCHLNLEGEVAFDRRLGNKEAQACLLVVLKDATPDGFADRTARFSVRLPAEVEVLHPGCFSAEAIAFLRSYLLYCFLPLHADRLQRAVTVAHFAQSLDGRIATCAGHSKWIGNQENLIHAHRMRALSDAILIGSGTLRRDRPRLTVRHVSGENPTRVIVGDSRPDISSLRESCSRPVLLIGTRPDRSADSVQAVCLPAAGNDRIDSSDILRYLYRQGIRTVYLEGGPTTTSNFLKDEAVDLLQLHLAPLLFGSGQPAIELPVIEKVSKAMRFRRFSFQPVGDTVMFVGEVAYGSQKAK